MTIVRKTIRRPSSQPANAGADYEASPERVQETKDYNRNLRYIQGFRTTVGAGATVTVEIKLKSPGRQLLGFSFIPVDGDDISDCQCTVSVNNNTTNSGIGLQNMNPNFVGSMVFFPVPQPLQGNDNIEYIILNNSASSITGTVNAFYVPQV